MHQAAEATDTAPALTREPTLAGAIHGQNRQNKGGGRESTLLLYSSKREPRDDTTYTMRKGKVDPKHFKEHNMKQIKQIQTLQVRKSIVMTPSFYRCYPIYDPNIPYIKRHKVWSLGTGRGGG